MRHASSSSTPSGSPRSLHALAHLRNARMRTSDAPTGELLIERRDGQNEVIVSSLRDNLQADRETLSVEAARKRKARLAGQVERKGQGGEPGRLLGRVPTPSGGSRGWCRRQDEDLKLREE